MSPLFVKLGFSLPPEQQKHQAAADTQSALPSESTGVERVFLASRRVPVVPLVVAGGNPGEQDSHFMGGYAMRGPGNYLLPSARALLHGTLRCGAGSDATPSVCEEIRHHKPRAEPLRRWQSAPPPQQERGAQLLSFGARAAGTSRWMGVKAQAPSPRRARAPSAAGRDLMVPGAARARVLESAAAASSCSQPGQTRGRGPAAPRLAISPRQLPLQSDQTGAPARRHSAPQAIRRSLTKCGGVRGRPGGCFPAGPGRSVRSSVHPGPHFGSSPPVWAWLCPYPNRRG
ncbi:hypothetical protein NDU88_005744 [Pleurodeles waltl]|uniref:Uncharacterized protein n=1 Tax=Pleurodeles waltl TaxID=8319 RepID=A0AAV7UK46_PLEWA|nr:hypothetical protein NDU88_005744 [Pleurodeles waltl]